MAMATTTGIRHDHDDHGHHDLNLKSAYVHVIADAATSVLAIAALVGGWLWGWSWLDPLMGLVGAVLVGVWAKGLVVDTAKVLLDREMDHPVVEEIREVVEADAGTGDSRLADLHVWRVGQGAYACALTVVTHDRALTPDVVRQRLSVHEEVVHSTIEIHHCPAHPETGGQSGAVRRPGRKSLICQAILILRSRAPQSASAQVLPLPGDKPAMPLPFFARHTPPGQFDCQALPSSLGSGPARCPRTADGVRAARRRLRPGERGLAAAGA
jgi:hypothetical protein